MANKALHILLIDNYDSFSYNLVEAFRVFEDVQVTIMKNDNLAILDIEVDAVIISPGPGLPKESGILLKAIDRFVQEVPILGVCLGLQAIVEYFDGSLRQLRTVYHGIQDTIDHDKTSPLFHDVNPSFLAGRYHSWVADSLGFPDCLQIISQDSKGEIMGIEHQHLPCYAVQFHPESYMTKEGYKMFNNFIALVREFHVNKAEKVA